MKITRRQLREALKELNLIKEDAIDTELDHLKKNMADDLDHIKDLKDDVKDDHDEELRAEKEKERKDESLRGRRRNKVSYRRLRAMIKEMHDEQGYDDREDERLAAEHGAEDDHEQSYDDRRDDAGFEEREGSHIEVHHHHHHEALKRRLRKIVRENTRRRRR